MRKKLYHQFACSSLMLPEHRAGLIRRHRQKSAEKRPEWDEQRLEELERLVKRSIAAALPVRITFFEEGAHRVLSGVIPGDQPHRSRLCIQTESGVQMIPLQAIIQVETSSDG